MSKYSLYKIINYYNKFFLNKKTYSKSSSIKKRENNKIEYPICKHFFSNKFKFKNTYLININKIASYKYPYTNYIKKY